MNAICIQQVTGFFGLHVAPVPVVVPHVCAEEGSCSSNIALVDTALHSVQQDIHQMRHTLNFTKRHACVIPAGHYKLNLTDSTTCLKANVLMNLLKEAEEVAESLDLDTYYFHRQRYSPREIASILLQGLGLLGTTIFFGYLLYYAVGSVFVTGVLLVDIFMHLPFLFAKIMFIPFFLVGKIEDDNKNMLYYLSNIVCMMMCFCVIVVEVFVFGYFLVGSFSLIVVLASVIESCSFLFAHQPVILEGLGVVTVVTAMLSLSKPFTSSNTSTIVNNKKEEGEDIVAKEEVASVGQEGEKIQ